LEGWRRCRTPPLGDPCGLSWGCAALRGLEPGGPGRLSVPVRPVGVSTPFGWSSVGPGSTAKPRLGPPCAFAPLQRRTPAAPHRRVASPTRRPGDRPAMLPLLGFGALRHSLGPADPLFRGGGSLRHRVPRARFDYLLRGLHHRPSRRAKRRSVHGLRPTRRSPRHERCPSRGPCPPDVAGHRAPEGTLRNRPPSGPRARAESVLPPNPRRDPAVDAFLGFSPAEPSPHPSGRSLVVTMPALSPLGGMTSLPSWTSGLRGANGSAGPFPDCQLSWGFAPFDRRGAPFRVPGSGLMALPHAGNRASAATTAI
jgi:hypothetical protein